MRKVLAVSAILLAFQLLILSLSYAAPSSTRSM